jgi:hypothetical protein
LGALRIDPCAPKRGFDLPTKLGDGGGQTLHLSKEADEHGGEDDECRGPDHDPDDGNGRHRPELTGVSWSRLVG